MHLLDGKLHGHCEKAQEIQFYEKFTIFKLLHFIRVFVKLKIYLINGKYYRKSFCYLFDVKNDLYFG